MMCGCTGTAIKLLLLPMETLNDVTIDPTIILSRQEVVAVFNLLNQLNKAVQFASKARHKELSYKLQEAAVSYLTKMAYFLIPFLIVYSIVRFFRRKSLSRKPEKSNSNDEKKMN
jgi:hypothetical protein